MFIWNISLLLSFFDYFSLYFFICFFFKLKKKKCAMSFMGKEIVEYMFIFYFFSKWPCPAKAIKNYIAVPEVFSTISNTSFPDRLRPRWLRQENYFPCYYASILKFLLHYWCLFSFFSFLFFFPFFFVFFCREIFSSNSPEEGNPPYWKITKHLISEKKLKEKDLFNALTIPRKYA